MKTLKKILKWTGVILLVLLATGFTLYLIYMRPFMQKLKQTSITKYDKDLTIVLGGGGNSGVLVSDSLVIVIDTKMDKEAEEFSKTVKELAGSRPILVVNTHFHNDHCGGNSYYQGQNILAGGNYTKEFWAKEAGEENMPTLWLKDKMDIKMGDDTATIFNFGRNAHTASDVFVYLHKRKMLFGGDVILNQQAPAIFGVADPNGYLAAFDKLQQQFDIQKVVPGHGPMGGIEVLETYRQYFNDMKTAAADDSKKNELIEKYKDWAQIPLLMSHGATIKAFKKKASS